MNDVLVAVVSGVLSGGLLASVVALYRARKTVPAERDNIVVQSAETAVLSLQRSLAAETRRADRAEAEMIRKDKVITEKERRIEELERRLDTVQQMLDDVRAELHQIRTSTTG